MTGRHQKPDTALQQNYSFTAVDDFDTRMYILEFIADKSKREALIAEHREAPRGAGTRPNEGAPLHSLGLKRLIDKLRVTPQAGKHTIIETKPWAEYAIGVLPGHRGGVVEISDERYPTREDAEHAIFLKRLRALMDQYDIKD